MPETIQFERALVALADAVETYAAHNTPSNFDAMMSTLAAARKVLKSHENHTL